MGINFSYNQKLNIKQIFQFEGNIYKSDNKEETYYVEGKVNIYEDNSNFNEELKIEGNYYKSITLNKNRINVYSFSYIGIEEKEQDNDNILVKKFKIQENINKYNRKSIKYNKNNNINLHNEIKLIKNQKDTTIKGQIDDYIFDLNLNLIKNIIKNPPINEYQIYLKKNIDNNDKFFVINSLIGLQNLGNTCYINSSLQILLHIPEFVELMLENNDYENNHIYYINQIINLYINNYKKNFKSYVNPSLFVQYFKKNHPNFGGYTQKDSQMFLEELLWEINSELSILNKKRPLNEDFYLPEQKEYYNYLKKTEEDSNYIMNDLFYVCFIHEKKCSECNKVVFFFDETPGLKLNFKKNMRNYNIDLKQLINDNFETSNDINSSISCERCGGFKFKIKTRIARLPKILIILLQKTNENDLQKLPFLVNFENELDLKTIVKSTLIYKEGETNYSFFAINNHNGSTPSSGHYFSQIYIKYFDKWFSFNDTSVSISGMPIPSLDNYALFYKKDKN